HGPSCLAPVRRAGEPVAGPVFDHQPGHFGRWQHPARAAGRKRARLCAQWLARSCGDGDGRMSLVKRIGPALLLALSPVAGANDLGREVFTTQATPACAICHTLAAAGATGEVGPSLDMLKPSKAQILE